MIKYKLRESIIYYALDLVDKRVKQLRKERDDWKSMAEYNRGEVERLQEVQLELSMCRIECMRKDKTIRILQTQKVTKKCITCKGTGKDDGMPCFECDGTGKVTTTLVPR